MLSPQIRRDRKERIPSPQRLLDGAKDQNAALLAGARCTCDRIRPDQHREAWRQHRDAVTQHRDACASTVMLSVNTVIPCASTMMLPLSTVIPCASTVMLSVSTVMLCASTV